MQDFGVKNASVQISGLKLALPFNINFTMPMNPFVSNVTDAISNILGIATARLQNVIAAEATDGNTLVSFLVLPASGNSRRGTVAPTSTEVVAMLQGLSRNSSAIANSLLQLLMPSKVKVLISCSILIV